MGIQDLAFNIKINYRTSVLFLIFYRADGWSSVAEAVGKGHSSQK